MKNTVSRRSFVVGAAATGLVMLSSNQVKANTAVQMQVFKSPYCGCCGAWVEHVQSAGFEVDVFDTEELDSIKNRLMIPNDVRSCHTAIVGDYIVEGHVPVDDVVKLLSQKPTAQGIAVPGMPVGSPGMESGNRRDPYDVVLFSGTERSVFSEYR